MSTQSRFKINGFLDTNNTVYQNIEDLATAAGSWVTFDSQTGKWSLVINGPTAPSFDFDDNNILSEISFTQKDFTSAYNSGRIRFPNSDQVGKFDEIDFQLAQSSGQYDYFSDEQFNEVKLSNNFINNVVQAQLVLSTEIRSSRRDFIIEFDADYSAIGVKAGDVVRITNAVFGFNNRQFRVVSINESDDETGNIFLRFTCVDYSADTYVFSGFTNANVTRAEPLPPIKTNTGVQNNIAESNGIRVGDALETDIGRLSITAAGIPLFETISTGWTPAQALAVLGDGNVGNTNSLEARIGPIGTSIKNIQFFFEGPQGEFDYVVDGTTKTLEAGIPVRVTIDTSTAGINGPWTEAASRYMEWSTYTTTIAFSNQPSGLSYRFRIYPLNTYDLNATNNFINISSVSEVYANAAGDATSLTIAAFLN